MVDKYVLMSYRTAMQIMVGSNDQDNPGPVYDVADIVLVIKYFHLSFH